MVVIVIINVVSTKTNKFTVHNCSINKQFLHTNDVTSKKFVFCTNHILRPLWTNRWKFKNGRFMRRRPSTKQVHVKNPSRGICTRTCKCHLNASSSYVVLKRETLTRSSVFLNRQIQFFIQECQSKKVIWIWKWSLAFCQQIQHLATVVITIE